MPSASDLSERVTFSERTTTDDGYGGVIGGFSDQFTEPAGFTYLRGGESVLAARLTGTQPVVITVRYSSNTSQIKTDWQATNARDGTVYAIKSIAPNRDNDRFLDITAVAGEAA